MIQPELPMDHSEMNHKAALRLNAIGLPFNDQTRPFVRKLLDGRTLIWVSDRNAIMVTDVPISRIVSKG